MELKLFRVTDVEIVRRFKMPYRRAIVLAESDVQALTKYKNRFTVLGKLEVKELSTDVFFY